MEDETELRALLLETLKGIEEAARDTLHRLQADNPVALVQVRGHQKAILVRVKAIRGLLDANDWE